MVDSRKLIKWIQLADQADWCVIKQVLSRKAFQLHQTISLIPKLQEAAAPTQEMLWDIVSENTT